MTDLSPAAQAVLDAFWEGLNCGDDWGQENLAAALRAAADNAPVPHPHEEDGFHCGFWAGIKYIRSIATELEGVK